MITKLNKTDYLVLLPLQSRIILEFYVKIEFVNVQATKSIDQFMCLFIFPKTNLRFATH